MANIRLFQRKIRVTVSTIQITDLDMSFHVKKSLKPEPNTAEVTIYNLNPDHRASLEQMKVASVQIEAGYKDGMSTLFLGDLRTGLTEHTGSDYLTKLSSGDGEKKVKTSRVKFTAKKNTTTNVKVLEAVAKSLGVGEGNLKKALATIQGAGIANLFVEGTVFYGSAFQAMNQVCSMLGLTWSIQDGKLQILTLRTALEGQAIHLSSASGMVGAPTVDNSGVLSLQMLLIPDVFPGRKLVVDAERLKGQYRIEECEYEGATWEKTWYIKVKAKRY